MSKLRLAVVGGGHLGRIHARLASTNDQFEVVGVADPSSDSRQLVEKDLQLPTFANYQDLIGKVDAAVVAAPTSAHYEITSNLLRSGIHCLVEKPLSPTPDQAQRLVQLSKYQNRVLQVGHVERFNPCWTAVQDKIGAPKFIEATRTGVYSGRSTDIGVVLDLMIHDLDLVLSLEKSEVIDIQATGFAVVGSQEDIAEARISFASGCIANIRACRIARDPVDATRRMQIYSTAGYADVNFSSDEVQIIQPTADVLGRMIALDELPANERAEAKQRIYEDMLIPETIPASKRNAILDEQNDFAISIDTGSPPAVSGEDGARAVTVASQILSAIQSHGWDGVDSKPWRIGPRASAEPRILQLPVPERSQEEHKKAPRRKAG